MKVKQPPGRPGRLIRTRQRLGPHPRDGHDGPFVEARMSQPALPPVTTPGTDTPPVRLTELLEALVVPGDRALALRLLAATR